ncbi:MAG TPA: hypothetical protein VGM91_10455 [Conexibacter sp.]|jgi:hypothetical protein
MTDPEALAVATLYGRHDEVDALARLQAPVTVLAGDSGTGKSAVLAAAQDARPDALAPAPRTVRYMGVLQQALLQALADAVTLNVRRRGKASEVADHLFEAARRIALEQSHELASVVAQELLAVVRGRLGSEFGRAFEQYIRKLRESVDESLSSRLNAALDPGVTGLVVGFAEEVARAAECDVLLALDAGERLSRDGIRLLADIAESLPDSVRIRIAIADYTSEQQREVAFLETVNAVAVRRLDGLTVTEVAEWLEGVSLDPGLANAVQRVTGGYALHVGDLVGHLQAGGEIEDMPLSQQFAKRTREGWDALDLEVVACARRLAAFHDSLPRDATIAFLDLDDARWGAIEDALWRARVFSVYVDGRRWFHEQRRRFVYDSILGVDERDRAASEAVPALYRLIVDAHVLDREPELATIAADAISLQNADEQLAGVLAMDSGEIALVASLIELVEGPSSPAVFADVLLRYARRVFDAPGDLIDALDRAKQRNSIAVVVRGDAAAVVPYFRTGLVLVVVAGRASAELGRLPVQRAASAAWQVQLQPRIEPFDRAQYGLGTATAGGLGEIALELRKQRDSGIVVVGQPDLGENLLIRAEYGERPLYAAVTFKTASDRDAAEQRLKDADGELFGERFEVHDVFAHPTSVVPARRLIRAAERLTDVALRQSGSPTLRLRGRLDAEARLQRKAAAIAFARAHLTFREQLAASIEKPIGYAYSEEDDLFLELEIIGGRTGVHRIELPAGLNLHDPYAMFRLAVLADLAPDEYVGHYRLHVGYGHETDTADPAIELFELLQNRSAIYNASQPQLVLPRQEEPLRNLLATAAKRTYDDAVAMGSAIEVGDEKAKVEPRVHYVTILFDPPDPSLAPGWFSKMHVVECDSPDGQEQLHLRIIDQEAHSGEQATALAFTPTGVAELFGLSSEPTLLARRMSDMHMGVARILGHEERHITFERPD